MGKFNISCPQCQTILEVQDEWAGMETNCPNCQTAFTVPERAPAPVMTAPAENPSPTVAPAGFDAKCPHCGTEFEAQAEWEGMETDCPSCGNHFVIARKQAPKLQLKRNTPPRLRRTPPMQAAVPMQSQPQNNQWGNAVSNPIPYANPVTRTGKKPHPVKTGPAPANTMALVSYYLGVGSLIFPLVLGLPAVIYGIIGLVNIKNNPGMKGGAHAWTGIILGIFGCPLLLLIVFIIIKVLGY